MSPGVYEISRRPTSSGFGRLDDVTLLLGGGSQADSNRLRSSWSTTLFETLIAVDLEPWRGMTVLDCSLNAFCIAKSFNNNANSLYAIEDPVTREEATWEEPRAGELWTRGFPPDQGLDPTVYVDRHGRLLPQLDSVGLSDSSPGTWQQWRKIGDLHRLLDHIQDVLNGDGPTGFVAGFTLRNNQDFTHFGAWASGRFYDPDGEGAQAPAVLTYKDLHDTIRPYFLLDVEWP